MLHNDPRDIQIRRNSSALFNIGTGILAFSVWNVVKLLYFLPSDLRLFRSGLAEAIQDVDSLFVKILIAFFVFLIILLMDLINIVPPLYVGRRARAMGRGEKVGREYIVLALLMIAGSLVIISLNIYTLYVVLGSAMGRAAPEGFPSPEKSYQYLTTIFIELTSVVMMIEIVVNDRRIRRLREAGRGSADSTEEK